MQVKDGYRESSEFYVVPHSNSFANQVEWAYGVDGAEDAQRIADHFDGKVVDANFITELRERMHLAEGCSHNSEYEHDYQRESADEFVDHITVVYEDPE